MPVATLVSVEEYLATAFRPDCDFVDGQVLERNVGPRNHSQTQGYSYAWFLSRRDEWKLEPFVEQRVDVTGGRFRVPDVLLVRQPVPKEQVLTQPPYLCFEVMSPDDTMSGIQDRLDDYMTLGVPNIM